MLILAGRGQGPTAVSSAFWCAVCFLAGAPGALAQSEPPATELILIPTVDVEGDSESAVGPDSGYAARTTATGSKTATPLTEIPQSVSVVTRKQMDDRQPAQLEDTLTYMAGVTASPWGVDDRFDECLIRGFDICTSTLYRDGLSQRIIGFSGFKIEPYGMERIEVLKGPASVLYGENDAGGMINAITKRPPATPLYSGYLSYGSFRTFEAGVDVGGPIDEAGTVSYRLTGLYKDGANEMDHSENDRIFIAPALTWQPDPDTALTILTNYQWDELEPLSLLPVAGEDYPARNSKLSRSFFAGSPDFNRYNANHGSVGYQFSHAFNERWTVRQNARVSRQETDYRDLYYGDYAGGPGMIDDHTMARTIFTVDEVATIFNVDNQVEYDATFGPVSNRLLVGLDYNRLESDGVYTYGEGPPLDIFDPDYSIPIPEADPYQDGVETVGQAGLYAQNQMKIAERFLLTFGGRQSWVKNDFEDRLWGADSHQKDRAFSRNVGVGYLFDNGMTPYASYSESFTVNLGQAHSGDAFVPSRGKQYEVGLKYEPTFFPVYITAALFDLTKTNVLTTDPDHPNFQVQTGEVRHRGFELEATADLRSGLSFVAAYTFIDAEITSDNDGFEGNRPSLVPEHQASLWANYEVPQGPLEGLSFGAGVRFVGDTYGDGGNTLKVPDYTLFDAALRYRRGNWQGSVNVSNLFDRTYYATCYTGAGCAYGEGRIIKAVLSAKF